MKVGSFIMSLMVVVNIILASEEITPYKFTDQERPIYNIPESSRFIIPHLDKDTPDIVYYLSKPKTTAYPIAILCGGSSSKEHIDSIIHFHRYFIQEFLDLDVGVLTVEQSGIDGNKVNIQEFMEHYTRSKRLQDHKFVIEHLKSNPPNGWNGELIFLGVSEGGPIVTSLTTFYSDITIAAINWCGAGDWSWRDELWVFIQKLRVDHPKCCSCLNKIIDPTICSENIISRERYDSLMEATLCNPTTEKYFVGMTYKYHADALTFPVIDYSKILSPFLVVAGAQDTIIHSSDAFVEKAESAGANITYLRVQDMDHYIRKRPDIIKLSFEWLQDHLK